MAEQLNEDLKNCDDLMLPKFSEINLRLNHISAKFAQI
jgi:hypothetical protein